MKVEKTYTVKTTKSRMRGNPYVNEQTGTLPELIKYFGYTLEVGHSWDKKVNENPKNINSFVTSLQRAYEAKEAQCFDRTYVELIKD
jgi:hypothetical protein